MSNNIFLSSSNILYDLSSIHLYQHHLQVMDIVDSPLDQFTVGSIAQLVDYCTGIIDVMGLNPFQYWTFFMGFNFTAT